MMKNALHIGKTSIEGKRLSYRYRVEGDWTLYFKDVEFYIEYEECMESVPESVLVVPLLGQVLPIAWLCDACIYVEEVDADFYTELEMVKQGYREMYPDLRFEGELRCTPVKNVPQARRYSSAALFSGGVDAFYTFLTHRVEQPLLIAIWGADVRVDNEQGWSNVRELLDTTSRDFEQPISVIKSSFREIADEGLWRLVAPRYEWWHDFQYGMGLLSHAAPLAYLNGFESLYISSSFTREMKGQYVCSSDPTTDDHVHFCGSRSCHDGYDADRCMKIHAICQHMREQPCAIYLRVCWMGTAGRNCCCCEKCHRTIFSLISEGQDPNSYGFEWNQEKLAAVKRIYLGESFPIRPNIYRALCKNLKKNRRMIEHYADYDWLTRIDWDRFDHLPVKVYRRFRSKGKSWMKRALYAPRRVMRFFRRK